MRVYNALFYEESYRYVMSPQRTPMLHTPPGHANGFMSLTVDARLVFFSNESRDDDVRFDAR
jgi:dTDP-4-dehydrorhamnose 3,5-epimerase-like enzyme